MKRIYLKGTVLNDAKLIYKEHFITFTVAVKERYDYDLNKYLYKLVTCLVIEPSPYITKALIKDCQDLEIEFEGVELKLPRKLKNEIGSERVIIIPPEYLKILKNRNL